MAASPPPLKRPPPVRPAPSPVRGGRDVLRDAIDSLEGETVDDVDDPAVGQWLFKENDVVKGPVGASVVSGLLKSGDADGTLLVARKIGAWVKVSTIPFFAAVLQERQRGIDEERKKLDAQVAARKRVAGRAILLAVLLMVPLAAGAALGHATVKARPWDRSDMWLAKVPPVLNVKPKPKPKPKTKKKKKVAPPDDVAARDTAPAEDAEPSGSAGSSGDKVASADTKRSASKKRQTKRTNKSKTKTAKATTKGSSKASDPKASAGKASESGKSPKSDKVASAKSGLPRTLTKGQIMGGLSQGKSGFGRCIRSALKKSPEDIPPTITIGFTVANDGKATGVTLQERQVRGSTLEKCIQGAMAKITWPKFYGERKYTRVPFNISKPK